MGNRWKKGSERKKCDVRGIGKKTLEHLEKRDDGMLTSIFNFPGCQGELNRIPTKGKASISGTWLV